MNIIRRFKWTIQRGLRGYADCDVWNMSDYLISIILPMLKQLKKVKRGYPCNHYKGKCHCKQNWDKALKEMIEGWEAAERLEADNYPRDIKLWRSERLKDERIFRHKMRPFAKYFFALWD